MASLSLPEAVAAYAPDGARVYLGNFGAQLFCVGHELIRQRRRELDVVIASGGLLLDQLFGAGLVRTATFGHCWSPVGPTPAWNFRRLAESGAAVGRTRKARKASRRTWPRWEWTYRVPCRALTCVPTNSTPPGWCSSTRPAAATTWRYAPCGRNERKQCDD